MNKPRLGMQPIGRDVALLRVLLGKCGLAQPVGYLPWATYGSLLNGISVSGTDFAALSISRDFTIRSWAQSWYIFTTNDGSNYWRFEVRRWDTNAVLTDLSWNTSTGSAATSYLHEWSGSVEITKSMIGLYIRVYKTGSPGALVLFGPAMFAV